MPSVKLQDIEIAYEIQGDLDKPCILLVHGLSMSLVAWPPSFLRALRNAGFTLIMFDNRDMGLSDTFANHRTPNFAVQLLKSKIGLGVSTVYKLEDMMNDAIGLLDYLKIDKAHLVGVSMGGMISQLIAINHPERVKTLTSIMSTTGGPNLPGPEKKIISHILSKPSSKEFADILAFTMKTFELIEGPDYKSDPEIREMLIRALIDRGMKRDGTKRQMLAIAASNKRYKRLSEITAPTLVIHGEKDPLVPLVCGQATADAIPGARFEVIQGMGHSFPQELLSQVTDLIVEHCKAHQ